MSDLPARVRSADDNRYEQSLHWLHDDIHPYTYLDQKWLIRAVPGQGAFTQMVNRNLVPKGKVLSHNNVAAALAALGWEIAR